MKRYYSLDVFRGFTVAFMILVNNQMGKTYEPLDHAPWHGLTPTDLVFPFFLFVMGNALSFVMPRMQQAGTKVFLVKVIKRTLLIFFIGLFLNWSPFIRWDHDVLTLKGWTWLNDNGIPAGVRVMSVLGRIALAYFFASLIIYFCKPTTAIMVSIVLLVLYWLLCAMLGSPPDPYSLQGYFGTAIDKFLFSELHMYHGEGVAFDPEGIASTIPSIVSVVIGYITGNYIRQKGNSYEMLAKMFLISFVLLFAGYCWNMYFPVNKKIWTSSYVLAAGGLAMITLGIFIYSIEFKNWKGNWSKFFDVFGKNPLFIFVLSGFVPRVLGLIRIPGGLNESGGTKLVSPFYWFYQHVCKAITFHHEKSASVLFALILLSFYWLIGYVLDKRKIYIKV